MRNQLYRCRAADRAGDRQRHQPAGAGRHRGRHRAQRARRGSQDDSARRLVEITGHPFMPARERVRGARVERPAGPPVGHAQHAGGRADQDRQRYPPARLGPALGDRRAASARERAGQLDHAGQGQPDPVRDADDGRGAGDRQPPGGHRRRDAGASRAQRVQAADRRRRAALDRPAGVGMESFAERCVEGSNPIGGGSPNWSTAR